MKIKQKMFLPLLALILILAVLGLFMADRQASRLKESFITKLGWEKQQKVYQFMDTVAMKNMEQAAVFAMLPQVMTAYEKALSGNIDDPLDPMVQEAREDIRAALGGHLLGQSLVHGSGEVLRLHFHLPNGYSFVRMWREKNVFQDGSYLDMSEDLRQFRDTINWVMDKREPIYGFEAGRGGPALRGVLPIHSPAGKYLGSVEVLSDFNSLWELLDLKEGHRLHLFMGRDLAGVIQEWNDGQTGIDWEQDYVLVAGQDHRWAASITGQDLDRGIQDLYVRIQGREALAAFPLPDFSGQDMGVVVLMMDITQEQAVLNTQRVVLWAFLASVMVMFFFFSRHFLQRSVLDPISRMRTQMRAIQAGSNDPGARLKESGSDEIADLARDFNGLIDSFYQVMNMNRIVLNAIPDPVFVVGPDFKFIQGNHATKNLAGIRETRDLQKLTCSEVFKADCCDSDLCPVEILKRGQRVDPDKIIRWEREDGQAIYIRPVARKLKDRSGNVVGYLELAQDVTRHVLREKDLEQKNRLLEELNERLEDTMRKYMVAAAASEIANRTKSEFLANMSHEIRTPMNGIMGMTELALNTELTPEQREYLSITKTSAESLLSLIDDILDFSKIEAGRLDIDHVSFKLRDTVDDSIRTLAVQAHAKGLDLNVRIQPSLEDMYLGDPDRLRQILINLVSNAIKFTQKGEVEIKVQEARERKGQMDLPQGHGPAKLIHFTVSDSGMGIAHEDQKRIFETFVQLDGSSTRKQGGTGLGLAICKNLISLMNGTIWVESEPDSGSSFHFVLPLEPAKDLPLSNIFGDISQLKGVRVLVVDDNATNRKILEEILSYWGMDPVSAENGAQALDTLEREEKENSGPGFGLMILDIHMPGMDGFEVLERMTRAGLARETQVIVLTSGAGKRDTARLKGVDVFSFMMKPVKQSELLSTIINALNINTQQDHDLNLEQEDMLLPVPSELNILLAEDNEINQKLAVHLLKRRGHNVVAVSNGRDVLQVLDEKSFDLILMDVQMPEMDGLEAARRIRKTENRTGRRIPIIAVTAHALKGDRDRCLEAGMDSYVQKPMREEELFREIARVLNEMARVSPARSEKEDLTGPVNLEAALARIGNDVQLMAELGRNFLQTCPGYVQELEKAFENADHEKLALNAHTLKGMLGVFAAETALGTARKLELMGRNTDMDGAQALLVRLREEIKAVETVIRDFIRDPQG
ncbi:response regulator [Desulfonatronovibrio hydrogenovorans]|uniref:response regulator n=1 Tax=Desulfonatronovibrio hydrogenovorans TaxID=53245 RepID=UPI00068DA9E4|nr:response regulator [Desulfonatronovibrio hydrogenovorans]